MKKPMRMIERCIAELNWYQGCTSEELFSEILEDKLLETEYKAHILEGLMMVVDNFEDVFDIIKNATDNDKAKEKLMRNCNYSKEQADAIIRMKLKQLTELEKEKLGEKYSELLEVIKYLKNTRLTRNHERGF